MKERLRLKKRMNRPGAQSHGVVRISLLLTRVVAKEFSRKRKRRLSSKE
jgi:hypothetical protein